ncbi:adenylyltransferase/cytidyltransferase family protein [archaeon]|jgi:D-beta-D-heptose 7-phosphate kinase / D-beta-D-heptose 1-phosphate adenosyltransferase|nr:adenylyltransferase/cytidyltransferase family protein [archaeon]
MRNESFAIKNLLNKFKTLDELIELLGDFGSRDKTIVYTNGCFDLLHVAHVELLERANYLGDLLIVGLSSDSSINRTKGLSRPIICEKDRVQIVSALDCVDYVGIYQEDTPCEMIARLKPDIHVKGSDYNPEDYSNMPEAEVVRGYGGRVEIIDTILKKSTSEIIRRIRVY